MRIQTKEAVVGLDVLQGSPTNDDVVKAVSAEIKALGDNSKSVYAELRKNYDVLTGIINGLAGKYATASDLDQIKKLAEDIVTRQAALDDANVKRDDVNVKRIDNLEVILKRAPKESIIGNPDYVKEVEDFFISAASVKNKEKGVTVDELKTIRASVNEATYKDYHDAYLKFLRMPGDERLLESNERKALSVGTDPDGGYTVTPAMSNRIITKLYERDPIRQLANIETITTGALEYPVDWSEAGCGWEDETQAGTQSTTAQFGKKRIPVHIMYAKPRASQVLLEDSGINIENWISDKAVDKFDRTEAEAFVSATGEGKPRGFLTNASGTTFGTVEQVNMGAAAALTADGFIRIKYALQEYYLNLGTWLMARSTVLAAMLLKDGQGNYIWKPGFQNDSQANILGLPVRMSTSMPTVAVNALSVALAYWKEAYTIVDRLGISLQKDPYTIKPMVEFYFRKRVGGDVTNYDAIKIGVIHV